MRKTPPPSREERNARYLPSGEYAGCVSSKAPAPLRFTGLASLIRFSNSRERESATDAEVVEAAAAAAATDFIDSRINGYLTQVGERGNRLSGGERQRIAIARAILKNAPILVLDEATSALDVETEARVKAAVDALRKNRTTFIIAHRLSTVRDADLVLFLDQGRIIEKGTFDELTQRGGRFTSLLRTSGLLTEDENQQPRPKAIAS